MSSAAQVLEQVAKEVAVCTRCSLCKNRTKTVPGEGSSQARLLFIGEAPGYHEDLQGKPFVGPSGDLLNKLLRAIKIPREEVFIANVVKCRPPNNADPMPDQIEACKPYLDRQIAAINPRLIVTLGRFSMARYWPGQRISQVHGQPKADNGRLHMAMFHPAAALRDTGRTMAMFKEDGLSIPDLLEKAEEIARTELWGFSSGDNEIQTPQPVLATVAAPHKVAETSAKLIYTVEPAPVEAASSTEAEGVSIPAQDLTPQAEPVAVEVGAVASESPLPIAVKAIRERKPKPVNAPVPIHENGNAASHKIIRPRKKRSPAPGDQLTMF